MDEAKHVEILDIDDVGALDPGGTYSRKPASDWAKEVQRRAATRKRQKRPFGLRLQWPARDWTPNDWFDRDEEPPSTPNEVDVIAPSDAGLVRVRLRLRPEGALVVHVELRAEPGGDLTAEARRQGLGWLLRDAEKALAGFDVSRVLGTDWGVAHPGRSGRPDSFYAEKALRYVEALEAGDKSPIDTLVKEANKERWTESAPQWRAWLKRARDRGLLTDASAGKAGGELTEKGRKALKPKIRGRG